MADSPAAVQGLRPAPGAGTHASTCRWATPTLFLDLPLWLDAEASPWACVRGPAARVLETTDRCAGCPFWEPLPAGAGEREG